MLKVVTAAEMREIDSLTGERFGVPSLLLMENAAQITANTIEKRLNGQIEGKEVLILCGKGNNGGDGAALARKLCVMGAFVDVVLFGQVQQTKGDAGINFDIVQVMAESGHSFRDSATSDTSSRYLFNSSNGTISFYECETDEEFEDLIYGDLTKGYDVLVDALLGTGLSRPVEGLYKEVVDFFNRYRKVRTSVEDKLIVSLDIPSGLNADSATTIGETVRADLTVTFTAPKPANVLPPASRFNGELVIADIGSPAKLIEESPSNLYVIEKQDAIIFLMQTRYAVGSYKNSHGHALIIAGSRGMTGAAVLCGNAAMSAGCGLVTVATAYSVQSVIASQLQPEVMTIGLEDNQFGAISYEAAKQVQFLKDRADVIAIGPGLSSQDSKARGFVLEVIEKSKKPIVVDADGLNVLADFPRHLKGTNETPLVLTPHPGEMSRLIGRKEKDFLEDRVTLVRDFAVSKNAIVVLKGERTLVAAPDGRVFINTTGNPGVGTAGAGDTLTGIITSFIAQAIGASGEKADILSAVIASLYIAGLSADIAAKEKGMRSLVASDIREHISEAIKSLDPHGEKP